MDIYKILYRFQVDNGTTEEFELNINKPGMELLTDRPKDMPEWARLGFQQCPHCPLSVQRHLYCPAAEKLVTLMKKFGSLVSYHKVRLEVITEERMIAQQTTVQRAVGSLMGVIMATSGCPHMAFFKPMARFHLPLASEDETIFRAASMYMLAQYFRYKNKFDVDIKLDGLRQIYENTQLLNRYFAERLRVASKTDSVLNAIVELDVYAQTMTIVIQEQMGELSYLFDSFLTKRL